MELLGVQIAALTRQTIIKQIEGSTDPLFVVNINPEILLYAWRHDSFRDIINSAPLKIIDGVGVVLMARLLYGVKLERFPGVDLAEQIIQDAVNNKKIFLLGASRETNQRAIRNLNSKFQILNSHIKGSGGEFTQQEATQAITQYKPDILFVALGTPKQEQFIHTLFTQYPQQHLPRIAMGIGGAIDYWANPGLRAPFMLRRVGLEWLWRLVRQPWRVKRILNALIVFPVACLQERFHIY